jgi:hypothetical protein
MPATSVRGHRGVHGGPQIRRPQRHRCGQCIITSCGLSSQGWGRFPRVGGGPAGRSRRALGMPNGHHSAGLKLHEIPLSGEVKQGQPSTILCDVSLAQPRPILPPGPFRRRALNAMHRLSHPGVKAMQTLLCARYVWHVLRRDLAHWTKQCPLCHAQRSRHTPRSRWRSICHRGDGSRMSTLTWLGQWC